MKRPWVIRKGNVYRSFETRADMTSFLVDPSGGRGWEIQTAGLPTAPETYLASSWPEPYGGLTRLT